MIKIKTVRLKTPLQEKDVRDLHIGDVVYLDGMFYTGRTIFQKRVLDENILPPIDFQQVNVFHHVGPVMYQVESNWKPLSVDPTSSIRFEKFGPGIIKKLGVRAIIGKTTMGPATLKAMSEYGCIHLTKVGICGDLLAAKVKKVVNVFFREELGNTEATWLMEVENFGPFIVDMDTWGRNYFASVDRDVKEQLLKTYAQFGFDKKFHYTEV